MKQRHPLPDVIVPPSSVTRTRVPILMYHALEESRSVITISPQVFAWQMRWLHENDYQVISLSKLVRSLYNREPLAPRSIVITFDDGFESVYTEAFPILAQYGFPATVFLVSGCCGQHNNWSSQPITVPRLPLLTWTQITEMDRHGIEFGAHTISHPWLDRLAPEELEDEILTSKEDIEEHLGHAVEFFAYPYGRYNDAIKAIVHRMYAGACTTQPGLVELSSDPLALERIEILYVAHPLLFRGLSRASLPLYINLRRLLRTMASVALGRPWK